MGAGSTQPHVILVGPGEKRSKSHALIADGGVRKAPRRLAEGHPVAGIGVGRQASRICDPRAQIVEQHGVWGLLSTGRLKRREAHSAARGRLGPKIGEWRGALAAGAFEPNLVARADRDTNPPGQRPERVRCIETDRAVSAGAVEKQERAEALR